MKDKFLSVEEAARQIGRTCGTVRFYMGKKRIAAKKISRGNYVIRLAEIERFAKEQGIPTITHKNCCKCNRWLPHSEFGRRGPGRQAKFNLSVYCRECQKEISAPNQRRTVLGKYKVSPERYEEILDAQNNCCAICGQAERVKMNGKPMSLALDHDHATGQVRGILCHSCNLGIGALRDDIERLSAAIKYLKKHSVP
jgi:hypothetical protein